MANYQIMISTDSNAVPMVGAHMMRAAQRDGTIADWERIFPSQMAYRIVASTDDGPRIMTRTEARELGYPVLSTFPAANGSLGRNA